MPLCRLAPTATEEYANGSLEFDYGVPLGGNIDVGLVVEHPLEGVELLESVQGREVVDV